MTSGNQILRDTNDGDRDLATDNIKISRNEIINKDNNRTTKRFLEDDGTMTPKRSSHKCTACGTAIDSSVQARIHPLLGVLVCRKCYEAYGDGKFHEWSDGVDEQGDDNYCRWCVDGGDLFGCMNDKTNGERCHYCICRDCIETNLPDDPILHIDSAAQPDYKWHCYSCNPDALVKLRQEAYDVVAKFTGKKSPTSDSAVKKRKLVEKAPQEHVPSAEILKRVNYYRKVKDLTIEEISTKFDTIADLVSKKTAGIDKLLEPQIQGMRRAMMEFDTMIEDLKSQLIVGD